MKLSENFSLEELTFSQAALRQGIDNTPDAEQVLNLTRLCQELLEPVRLLLGVPLHVDSGFRSPIVNRDVGGDPASAHLRGDAADVIPIGMPLETAFDCIRLDKTLPFDKVIFECRAWIHLARPQNGQPPRHIAETATGGPGKWHYQLVGANV